MSKTWGYRAIGGIARDWIANRKLVGQQSGKDPWVDSACADCPGFLVPGAAPAPASTFVSEPQIVPLG